MPLRSVPRSVGRLLRTQFGIGVSFVMIPSGFALWYETLVSVPPPQVPVWAASWIGYPVALLDACVAILGIVGTAYWWRHRHDDERIALARRCIAKGDEVLRFLTDRGRFEPSISDHPAWNDYMDATIRIYHEKFGGTVVALYDELRAHKLDTLPAFDLRTVQGQAQAAFASMSVLLARSPTNPIGIRQVAQTLSAFGHRILAECGEE